MQSKELINRFKGKKVLLTGHTGFKGTWMLVALKQLGAQITGFALAPINNSLYESIDGDSLCRSVIGDIRDKHIIDQVVDELQPDYVFHLAAQALVLPSYENPLHTFEVNSQGTAHLLESLRRLKKKCCAVIVTTDKVYRNLERGGAFVEEDQIGGHDPYSGSKAAAEIIVDSYIRSFFSQNDSQVKVCTARAGNVIGGGDWSKHRIIPDTISSLANSKPVVIRNPSSIRPWQHVLEPIFGYLFLASQMSEKKLPDAFNFGPDPNESISVLQLVKRAIEIWGSGTYETDSDENAPHESGHLLLDSSKAHRLLKWQSFLTQMKSIDWTIQWYKRVLIDEQSAIETLTSQMVNYLGLMDRK